MSLLNVQVTLNGKYALDAFVGVGLKHEKIRSYPWLGCLAVMTKFGSLMIMTSRDMHNMVKISLVVCTCIINNL